MNRGSIRTKITSRTRAALICLALSTASAAAMAQSLSNSEYKAARDAIAAEYEAARAACAAMPSERKSRCYTEAKGDHKAARAELDARQKPGTGSGAKSVRPRT